MNSQLRFRDALVLRYPDFCSLICIMHLMNAEELSQIMCTSVYDCKILEYCMNFVLWVKSSVFRYVATSLPV